jgi:hypothetical protein
VHLLEADPMANAAISQAAKAQSPGIQAHLNVPRFYSSMRSIGVNCLLGREHLYLVTKLGALVCLLVECRSGASKRDQ